jgi:hypothetical protein
MVVRAALATISTPDLRLLSEVVPGGPNVAPTVEHQGAGERLEKALQQECLRIGFNSFAEFESSLPTARYA